MYINMNLFVFMKPDHKEDKWQEITRGIYILVSVWKASEKLLRPDKGQFSEEA